MELTNRTVLITGGTSGIGRELVRSLYERDNALVVLGRSNQKLDDLRREMPRIQTYLCDLSQRGQVEEAMDCVVKHHPDVSVLFNNAAVQFTPPFTSEDFDFDSIGYEVTTNLTAPLWIISMLLAGAFLNQDKAVIVNISSGLALHPKKTSAVYCATKAALHSVSQSLRYQLEKTPVTVTEAILPLVNTPMTHGRGSRKISAKQAAKSIIKGVETGRDEIYIGMTRIMPMMGRLAPGIIKNMLKRA